MKSSKGAFTCRFCCRGFARSDALKRHWKTCKVRKERLAEIPTVEAKVRGRKLRACDRCSRLKRACTYTEPCSACATRNLDCTYKRSQHSRDEDSIHKDTSPRQNLSSGFDLNLYEAAFNILETHHNGDAPDIAGGDLSLVPHTSTAEMNRTPDPSGWHTSWSIVDEYTLAASLYHRPTQLDMNVLIQFAFLENFTKAKGLVRSFECGSDDRRLSVTLPVKTAQSLRSSVSIDPASHWLEITQAALQTPEDEPTDASTQVSMNFTHQIVSQIRETSIAKGWPSTVGFSWTVPLETICYDFFHPLEVRKYLKLFWFCWYPNWPTIHRPSFDGRNASSKLVAAMAVLGACLSPDERDRVTAQIWLDVIEEIVFSDEIFSNYDLYDAWHELGKSHVRKHHLELLQAAYCVCLFQTWEGCNKSKRRILRQRFGDIVYVARDIGLAQASLCSIDTAYLANFEWSEYILRDSLIRIFSYICNIDASYALFFRHPPRMVVSELCIGISSPETCFQAQSKEDCFIELKTWRSKMGGSVCDKLTILSLVQNLSETGVVASSDMRRVFEHLSVLNLCTVVHALYSQVYRLETSGIGSFSHTETECISNALHWWKELWPSLSRDTELSGHIQQDYDVMKSWQRIGFIKHAPEYWLLAHLTLQKLQKRSHISFIEPRKTMKACQDDDMVEAKALIAELKGI